MFRKKPPEATSVAEALSGTMSIPSAKPKKRASESRQSNSHDEHLMSERKRARRRLVGAVVMVLAVIIGLPMVLDPEPKAVGKNIVIQIPSKDAPPIALDSKDDAEESAPPNLASDQTPAKLSKNATSSPFKPAQEEASAMVTPVQSIKSPDKADIKPLTGSVAKKDVPVKIKEEKKEVESKNTGESVRALAILDGLYSAEDQNAGHAKKDSVKDIKESSKESSKENTRIVVQIGAFATQEKVTELREKLTSAGIKSYVQKVETASGDKIRVRIGPFSDKESADKARKQLEKLGLSGSLLTL